jgi:nucleoside-diphosphate-sugar epimerase
MKTVQTILGSGGSIGIPLARELKNYATQIRLVSRNPKRVNETDELRAADLTNPTQVDNAIEGSGIVYVTIGFEYNLKVWQESWPWFMEQVINSCLKHQAKLVFFDNVYMYSRKAIPFMTEQSAIEPPSRKGMVRARVREMILDASEKKGLNALIARSADFYGPEAKNGVFNIMAFNNLAKGKKAQAFGDLNKIHTYTYVPDAAKATAFLGNTTDCYNQEWHVPTTKEHLSNHDWIKLAAQKLNTEAKVMQVPAWMVRMLGLFMPVMRELPEMLYQFEEDYIFDSSKYEKRFGVMATTPEAGLSEMVKTVRKISY